MGISYNQNFLSCNVIGIYCNMLQGELNIRQIVQTAHTRVLCNMAWPTKDVRPARHGNEDPVNFCLGWNLMEGSLSFDREAGTLGAIMFVRIQIKMKVFYYIRHVCRPLSIYNFGVTTWCQGVWFSGNSPDLKTYTRFKSWSVYPLSWLKYFVKYLLADTYRIFQ
jgi:hypothetical protein